ncbi:uncharacterized protein [Euphorbia lathyris]|uniref:uncharacterized protein isoform X2 n=1 Tax=Euphorbia lathyris TaxID=212925 RepID=UPI003314270C
MIQLSAHQVAQVMEEKRFGIRFHHKGEFLKTKYSGGICTKISNSVDADRFSYTVLMEHVKDDVGYTEIGGIYVNKGKMGGWKLVADDKDLGDFIRGFGGGDFLEFYIDNIIDNGIEPLMQMQPYVVIRPRPCLVQDKKVQPKRKFVTIQSIQKQERQKKKANEEDLNVRRKLPQGIASKDMADEENIQESNDISYEKIREMNIIENNRRIAALNLKQLSVCLSIHGEQEKGKEKFHKDSEEYCPENDSEHSSDEDDSKQTKQLQKNKVKVGPTTHSRTNIVAPNATEKEVGGSTFVQRNSSEKAKKDLVIGAHDVETDVRNTVPPSKQSCNKVLQRQGNKGIGSMAAFVALRERQKLAQIEDAQVENAQENDVDESFIVRTDDKIIETSSVNKRKRRGQTKMDIVHTRRHEERKVIMLNDNFQPVADDGKSTPELSNFLGTLVRYYVPLDIIDWRKVPDKDNMWEFVKDKYIIPEEGKPWVMRTIRDAWRVYKCRIKEKHYSFYDKDEERIQHKPKDIPIEEFKTLL